MCLGRTWRDAQQRGGEKCPDIGELSVGLVEDYVVDPERSVKLASAPDTYLLNCAGFPL